MISLDYHGNIFKSGCEALVNPTNMIGPMGAGLAKKFADRYPGLEQEYKAACKSDNPPSPSNPYIWQAEDSTYIICLPTKRHWKDKSDIVDIITGLDSLYNTVNELNIKSIAIPALGCGLGGLRWSQIRPIISYTMDHLEDVLIVLYPPQEKKNKQGA